VEGRKFHLIGCSNGGAAVLAVAARAPHLVASLAVITGFVPKWLRNLSPLRSVPSIRLFVGDSDELGHTQAIETMKRKIERVGGSARHFVLQGAGHFNIGYYIDMPQFWQDLEALREAVRLEAGEAAILKCVRAS